MATPYNLRARKRDDRSVQKSVKTPQSKRKRSLATKENVSDHEIDQDSSQMPPESDFLSLTTEETKKRLTWEDEEVKEPDNDRSEGGGEGVESDDSEAGPDDVSLTVARQQAKQQLHQQNIESEDKRKSIKEKRRRKHELYQQQKEIKRQQLRLERFDEEELKIVAATLSAGEVDKVRDDPPKAKKHRRKQKRTGSQPVVEQRRIGGVQVVAIATESSSQPCAAAFDRAKAFLDNRLYGNHSRRAPALTLHAKKYHTQPARNFHRTVTTT